MDRTLALRRSEGAGEARGTLSERRRMGRDFQLQVGRSVILWAPASLWTTMLERTKVAGYRSGELRRRPLVLAGEAS